MLIQLLAVGAGGALGAVLRYAVSLIVPVVLGHGFPYAIMLVNIIGSFLMGALAAVFLANDAVGDIWKLFLLTGVLGGFTTFSAFSLDAIALIENAQFSQAAIYIFGSVILSLIAAFLGLVLIRGTWV